MEGTVGLSGPEEAIPANVVLCGYLLLGACDGRMGILDGTIAAIEPTSASVDHPSSHCNGRSNPGHPSG